MSYTPKRKLLNAVPVADTWLTARQREVIDRYMRGEPREQIERDLGITSKTVDSHVRQIKHRLGALNLHHAIALVASANPIRRTPI